MKFLQLRLVIEQLELRRRAALKQKDDPFRLRGEVQLIESPAAWRCRAGGVGLKAMG